MCLVVVMAAAVIPLFQSHGLERDGLAPRELPSWRVEDLYGRLVEISGVQGGAQLTVAFGLVKLAQAREEPVAIVQPKERTFYPPDAEDSGIDLEALVVTRVPAASDVPRAAEHFVRSGAFGLVVLELGANPSVPMPLLTRLSGLAKKHECAVVFLTEKKPEHPSLGSLISLRGEAVRRRRGALGTEPGFDVVVRVTKDKRRAPGWLYEETCRGPAGLR